MHLASEGCTLLLAFEVFLDGLHCPLPLLRQFLGHERTAVLGHILVPIVTFDVPQDVLRMSVAAILAASTILVLYLGKEERDVSGVDVLNAPNG